MFTLVSRLLLFLGLTASAAELLALPYQLAPPDRVVASLLAEAP